MQRAAIDRNLEPRGDRISCVLPFHVTRALHPTLNPSDPHARSVLGAFKSEGCELKDLTGFPRLIYAAPGINPLRTTSTRWRVDWDLALSNGNEHFPSVGIIKKTTRFSCTDPGSMSNKNVHPQLLNDEFAMFVTLWHNLTYC